MRRGFSLVEVLLSVAVLSVLAAAIYGTMMASLRGIGVDRLTEAKRHLTLDLLEVLCQPYSALPALIKDPDANAATLSLSIDDALALVGMPDDDRPRLKAIFATGQVTGFTLVWSRTLAHGDGDAAAALRLNKLWVHPILSGGQPGPAVDSFRIFYTRGG